MNKKRIYIYGFFLLRTLSVSAQDWKADLLAMNKAYLDATSFRMNVEVQTYALKNDSKPLISYKGKVASSKGNYFTSLMGRTSIYNKHCALIIDGKQKLIIYKANENNISSRGGFSLAQLDSAFILMSKTISVKYLVNTPAEKRLQLTYLNNTISKLEISMNPLTNSIKQVVYYYHTKHPGANNSIEKAVITYSDIELNKPIDNSLFSEKKYIVSKKNKIIPADAYAGFQLVNQDQPLTP